MAERVPIGVVFLDLDGFKRVNDVEGHATGDLVLAEVAQRVQDAVRAGDFCARYGGDEFVILCRDADADAAGDVADRVRAAIAEPLAATASVITASVGVAVVDPRARAYTDDVLNDADAAMYRSKQAGGNRVTIVVA
jgi:diguanylate cyclase (GGDEF)-like protein